MLRDAVLTTFWDTVFIKNISTFLPITAGKRFLIISLLLRVDRTYEAWRRST